MISFSQLSLLAGVLCSCSDKSKTSSDGQVLQHIASDGEIIDPLSMPRIASFTLSETRSAKECSECHPTHYQEWRLSTHAYAMVDPVFQALVLKRRESHHSSQDRFCIQCHSNLGIRSGDIRASFRFDQLNPISMEGVTCESCHKISRVERTYNAGHVLVVDGPMFGSLPNSEEFSPHATAFNDLYKKSDLCASCHDVIETEGVEIERPFGEWNESPAKLAGQTCQSCHMPSAEGKAATDGPENRTIHSHYFAGVDVPLTGDYSSEDIAKIRENVHALLSDVAELSLKADGTITRGETLNTHVSVKNLIEGHNLPTGSTSIREMWISLQAIDSSGKIIYETGHLDSNGDLFGHFSGEEPYADSDLLTFNASLLEKDGTPTMFSWRAAELVSRTIPPLYTRTRSLFIPTTQAELGTLKIKAALNFRSHPPYLLRALGLDALIPKLEIIKLAESELSVEVN